MKTTSKWFNYWATRKGDWKHHHLSTWNHPHRQLIAAALKEFHWTNLMEIGCGAGANIVQIAKQFHGKHLGGVDINPDMIELAQKTFQNGYFKISSAEDLMLSDDACQVILTDMTLIYIGPNKISHVLDEIKRVSRKHVLLCEFHSTSWLERLKLYWRTGYFAHNYAKLLTKKGFYDIQFYKIPPEYWPGGEPQKTFAYLILARVPRRK